jgi:hypothetical protein
MGKEEIEIKIERMCEMKIGAHFLINITKKGTYQYMLRQSQSQALNLLPLQ